MWFNDSGWLRSLKHNCAARGQISTQTIYRSAVARPGLRASGCSSPKPPQELAAPERSAPGAGGTRDAGDSPLRRHGGSGFGRDTWEVPPPTGPGTLKMQQKMDRAAPGHSSPSACRGATERTKDGVDSQPEIPTVARERVLQAKLGTRCLSSPLRPARAAWAGRCHHLMQLVSTWVEGKKHHPGRAAEQNSRAVSSREVL